MLPTCVNSFTVLPQRWKSLSVMVSNDPSARFKLVYNYYISRCSVHVGNGELGNYQRGHACIILIGLITVFDTILTGRQSGQKLQCLYGNPIANNLFQN